jgi:hypothetical protein
MNKLETAKKKREIALEMLGKDANNEAVKEAIKAKFGSGISSGDLSNLRALLGKVGKNRKRPLPPQVSLTRVPTAEIWIPNNHASPRLHGSLKGLLEVMHQENVTSIQIQADGTVRLNLIQEFLLSGNPS